MDGSGLPFPPAHSRYRPTRTGHVVDTQAAEMDGAPAAGVIALAHAERCFSLSAAVIIRSLARGAAVDPASVADLADLAEAVHVTRRHQLIKTQRADASPARTASAPAHQETTR